MGLTEADAKALVSEGVLSADYDEHEEAIEFYDKALKIIETGEIYLNKGISLVELEKYDDSGIFDLIIAGSNNDDELNQV